jgi:hypothetical protein
LAILYRSIVSANNATIDANRAWISAVTAYIRPPRLGAPITYKVVYENIGESPAVGLHWRFDNGYFLTPPDDDGTKIHVSDNTTCADLEPTNGGNVEFPRGGTPIAGAIPHTFSGSSDTVTHATMWDQDMLNDRHRFYVQGCVAYSTMGQVGRPELCFNYIPTHEGGKLDFDVGGCPSGWGAE